jgi:WD40 repeat protein
MKRPAVVFSFVLLSSIAHAQLATIAVQTPGAITARSATFHALVNPAGQVTTVRFLWGTTPGNYIDSADAFESPVGGTSYQSLSLDVAGLHPNTVYYVASSATSSRGSVRSSELSFATSALPPSVARISVVAQRDSAFVTFLVFSYNATTTIDLSFGLTPSYTETATCTPAIATGDSGTTVVALLGGLTPGTVYHFAVSAQNAGGVITTNDTTFMTQSLPPILTSFSPTAGGTGSTVIVNGQNFDASMRVVFPGNGSVIRSLTGSIARSMVFSPDGEVIITGGHYSGPGIRLWRAKDGLLLKTIAEIQGNVSMALSPDGRMIAGGSFGIGDSSLRIWRLSDGLLLRNWPDWPGEISSLAFSPDGQSIACARRIGGGGQEIHTIQLIRVEDGEVQATLYGHTGFITALTFASDGRMLASTSSDSTVRIWQVSDGSPLGVLSGHEGGVTSAAFAQYGRVLASGSLDGTIRLWDAGDGSLIRVLHGDSAEVRSVAFSKYGETIAGGYTDSVARIWRSDDGSLLREFSIPGNTVFSVAFSPDGLVLAGGGSDGATRLWSIGSDAAISSIAATSLHATVPAECDSGYLIAVNSGGSAISPEKFVFYPKPIFAGMEPKSGPIGGTVTLRGRYFSGATSVTFGSGTSSDFTVISDSVVTASASNGGVIRLRTPGGEVTSPEEFAVPMTVVNGEVSSLGNTKARIAIEANGYETTTSAVDLLIGMASNSYPDTIAVAHLVPVAKDTVVSAAIGGLQPNTNYYYRALGMNAAGITRGIEGRFTTTNFARPGISSISPSKAAWGDTIVVTGQHFESVEQVTSDAIAFLNRTAHVGSISAAAIDPAGKAIALAGSNGTIELWEIGGVAPRLTLAAHTGAVYTVEFSPDGESLASGGADQTIRVWRVSDGVGLRTLSGQSRYLTDLAFSPNGAWLASVDESGLKVRRVRDGSVLFQKTVGPYGGHSVAFSCDGRYVAAAVTSDSTVRLFRTFDSSFVRSIKGLTWSLAFSPDGRTVIGGSNGGVVRMWRVSDGMLLFSLRVGEGQMRSLAFSPDGESIVAGSSDKSVIRWRRTDTTFLPVVLGTHPSSVGAVAYGPNGQDIISGSDDGQFRRWSVDKRLDFNAISSSVLKVIIPADSTGSLRIHTAGGDVSGTFSFTRLARPVLTGPVNGDTVSAARAVMRWQAVPGSMGYQLHLARDSAFAQLVSSISVAAADSAVRAMEVGVFFWRVRAFALRDTGNWSMPRRFVAAVINGVFTAGTTAIPASYVLSQNYPNPFNPSTTIRYGLPTRSHVSLTVYNTLGQQVAVLQNGEGEAGYHEVRFDGALLPSGVYFYRIRVRPSDSVLGRDSRDGAGSFTDAKALLLLK